MIRRPPRSTLSSSSAASDVYKRQEYGKPIRTTMRFWLLSALTAACTATLPPGDHTITIRAVNDTIIHIPPGATSQLPVLLALHGLGENYPDNFQHQVHLDAAADKHGFATVYPLGSISTFGSGVTGHTWDGGKCCFSRQDDLSFLRRVVNRTFELVDADRSRVYSVGFSAGGVMSHAVACQAADLFAAVVSVDGPIEVRGECEPGRPVPVLHFHGTLDPVFPFHGAIFNGATQTIASWRQTDKCVGAPTESNLHPLIEASISPNCSGGAEVQLVSIKGCLLYTSPSPRDS
eukprot:TRINITY_DN27607_c0_g1_i3.p1 TRINITY_DN27607_c0_g1~~TRINITY_DN27607_c0_g1_i3.p1  ORF type:complete len:291 (+),score=55.81 TRINITY_DN27607_c0_g1_i3:80-952(+)